MTFWMKKITAHGASIALSGMLALSPVFASEEEGTLDKAAFSDVYESSFLDKSYAMPVMVGGLAIAAGGAVAFSTMTGGAGAPAAGAGVGSFAAWVGGNVPGAYMIGLSTVGGYFGGNAIVGAAILNGASAALVATTGGSVVGSTIAGTAYLIDGFSYVKEVETKELMFVTKLQLTSGVGSDDTQDAIENIISLESKIAELASETAKKEKVVSRLSSDISALGSGTFKKAIQVNRMAGEIKGLRIDQKNLISRLQLLKDSQLSALDRIVNQAPERQSDILSLSIIAWNEHRYDLFQNAVAVLKPADVSDAGFYYYLKALSALSEGDSSVADRELASAMLEGPYALEPVILRSIIFGEEFEKSRHRLDEVAFFVEENFDRNKYKTGLRLPSLFFRLGSIFFENEQYEKAKSYFSQAHDTLAITQRSYWLSRVGLGEQEYSRLIRANIANADYMMGDVKAADALMDDITQGMSDEEAAVIMGLYEGSFHE